MNDGRQIGTGGGRWSLDKSIPAIVVLTLLTNVIVVVWYASQADARLTQVEHAQAATVMDVGKLNTAREEANIKIVELATEVKQILDIVQRLDRREGGEPPHPNGQ
jgi:hypothetical protein